MEEGVSAVIGTEEVAKNDNNLSLSRYMASADQEEVLSLAEVMVVLQEVEEERAEADTGLDTVLNASGLERRSNLLP